jgi:hypothetical protein
MLRDEILSHLLVFLDVNLSGRNKIQFVDFKYTVML